MRFTSSLAKGWLQSHPFFLLLLLTACSVASSPPRVAPAPPCGNAPIPSEERLAFVQVDSGLPRSGQWRDGFDLADMNGDGDLDLVHGPRRKGVASPAIFLGNGEGRFNPWRTAHYPPLPYDYGDAKAADFDGNGLMDVALSSHLRGLTVLVQEGDGHFSPWAGGLDLRLPAGGVEPPFASRAIAVIDWNGDGRPDLLALNEGPSQLGPRPPSHSMALFLNRGGEWQRVEADAPHGIFGTSIAAGDVDGDGKNDAVLGTNVAGARSLVQLGNGESWTSRELQSLAERAAVTAVALHDFDGDRRDAIIAASAWPKGDGTYVGLDIIRLMNDGDEAFALVRGASNDPIVTVVPADFDGDGRTDLLALRMRGSMALFRGAATGFVRDAEVPPPAAMAGCDASDAHAADLDRDGTPEVIVSYAGDLLSGAGVQCARGGGFVVWRVNSRP